MTADVSLLDRIHPGIYVGVPLAVRLPRQVDGHLAYLSIGWNPCSLVANILGDKVRSQLGKTTLAPAWHSVRSPAAGDASTMSTVRVEHVRKGLGGVALDVAPVASTTSKTYSHRHAGKAKNQDQLESHPGALDYPSSDDDIQAQPMLYMQLLHFQTAVYYLQAPCHSDRSNDWKFDWVTI